MKQKCSICQTQFDFISERNNRTLRQLNIFLCPECNENHIILTADKIIPLNGLYAIRK